MTVKQFLKAFAALPRPYYCPEVNGLGMVRVILRKPVKGSRRSFSCLCPISAVATYRCRLTGGSHAGFTPGQYPQAALYLGLSKRSARALANAADGFKFAGLRLRRRLLAIAKAA